MDCINNMIRGFPKNGEIHRNGTFHEEKDKTWDELPDFQVNPYDGGEHFIILWKSTLPSNKNGVMKSRKKLGATLFSNLCIRYKICFTRPRTAESHMFQGFHRMVILNTKPF